MRCGRAGRVAGALSLLVVSSGCGSSADNADDSPADVNVGAPVGGSGGSTAGLGTAGNMPGAGTMAAPNAGAGGAGAGTTAAGMGPAGTGGAGGEMTMEKPPPMAMGGPSELPSISGECPPMQEGTQKFLGRDVFLWVADDASSRNGPLLFYWHGTSSAPIEALAGYGQEAIDAVKAGGGMVAAFDAKNGAGMGMTTGNNVWYYEDFDTADEVLACAIEHVGIDTTRIHAAGMSAGGLQTTAMFYARSNYLASVVVYSGGVIPFVTRTEMQDPANKLPAMIVHGGDTDSFSIVMFQESSNTFKSDLDDKGHFSFICNHGMGHTIPMGFGVHAWRFFQDHPYGVEPDPYADGLPASLPDYCSL